MKTRSMTNKILPSSTYATMETKSSTIEMPPPPPPPSPLPSPPPPPQGNNENNVNEKCLISLPLCTDEFPPPSKFATMKTNSMTNEILPPKTSSSTIDKAPPPPSPPPPQGNNEKNVMDKCLISLPHSTDEIPPPSIFATMKTRSMTKTILRPSTYATKKTRSSTIDMPPPPPHPPQRNNENNVIDKDLVSLPLFTNEIPLPSTNAAMKTRPMTKKILMPPPPPRLPQRNNENNAIDLICPETKKCKIDSIRMNNINTAVKNFPTELLTFHSSDHGKLRRYQRNIGVRDLKSVKKYGKRTRGRPTKNGEPTTQYDWKGIRYIENDVTKQEITSWNHIHTLEYKQITDMDIVKHKQALKQIQNDIGSWVSHSVCIVDTSGSMKNSDVKGSRTRLKAVWMAMAVDYVQKRIESGEATDMDVITVISLGPESKILIQEQPTNWILFNALLDMFQGPLKKQVKPCGHGFFLPALQHADDILSKNPFSSCSLVLAIFSDGRPSDFINLNKNLNKNSKKRLPSKESCKHVDDLLQKTIEKLASRLGKRLTVATIGMGSSTDFTTLRGLTDTAKDFGAVGKHWVPSMSTSGLGAALTSIATSLTLSQTAMTLFGDNGTRQKMRTVRNVVRQRKSTVPLFADVINPDEFFIYDKKKVIHRIYDPNAPSDSCFKDRPLQHQDARKIAICKKAFDEGTERIVYQFFELEADGCSVAGNPLIAKESRFVEDHDQNEAEKERYVRKFCSLQHKAKIVAQAFNDKLDEIKTLHKDTPRVSFLDCSVYYLCSEDRGDQLFLVERRLGQEFQKWNNNNGGVFRSEANKEKKTRTSNN